MSLFSSHFDNIFITSIKHFDVLLIVTKLQMQLVFFFLADLGQMKGNRRPVCKRSGVQEITSFDRSMYRKFKFCLRLHKLGAFLRCFSCSHLFVLEQWQRCNSLWFEMDLQRRIIPRIVTLQCSLKQNWICFELYLVVHRLIDNKPLNSCPATVWCLMWKQLAKIEHKIFFIAGM